MIDTGRQIATSLTLLATVLFPVSSLLPGCCCDAHEPRQEDCANRGRCCKPSPEGGGAAASGGACGQPDADCCTGSCTSSTAVDDGACTLCADCGTAGSPASESPRGGSCHGAKINQPLSAPAEGIVPCPAPAGSMCGAAQGGSGSEICIMLCRYRL